MPRSTDETKLTLRASVASIRRFADSFEGLTLGKVRNRLAAGSITQEKWEHGKQLVAKFPNYQVRVFFFAGKAQVTSVHILSK